MSKKFCELCNCTNHSDMPGGLVKNWACPLLGGKNICLVDCQIEIEGGLGAPDTLNHIMKLSGKSAWEVHQACVACPHGGKVLNKVPKLVSIRGSSGNQIKSGPEFEEAKRRHENEWKARLERLKDPAYQGIPGYRAPADRKRSTTSLPKTPTSGSDVKTTTTSGSGSETGKKSDSISTSRARRLSK